ncbi:MAG: hypothetical protein RQ982_03345 [Gammaproteobacteria bacterium]|nr:hypothetical protein [Gammaproteobacteria bacterium]
MKLALLLAILSISSLHAINASAAENDANENAAYCNEQVQLTGIEDVAEKSEYIKECMESFGTPSDDAVLRDNG